MTSKIQITDRQTYSFFLLPKLLFQKFHLSPYAILTYTALKYYARGSSETCERMSIRTLAKLVGVSEATFKRSLIELEKKGIIRVRHRSTKSAAGRRIPQPNLYELIALDSTDHPML